MTKRLLIIPLLAATALLGACDDHHNNSNNTSPSSATQDFSGFVQALIANNTCQSTTPRDLTSLNFTFDSGQDQASPVSVDNINPGCVF